MKHPNDRHRSRASRRPQSKKEIDELLDDESNEPGGCVESDSGAEPQNADGGVSKVQAILNLAGDIDLFHTPDMRPYAKVLVPEREQAAIAAHYEILGVKSQPFKSWLLFAYFQKTKSAPPGEALTMAIRTLDARACYEGREQDVYIRVGADGDCQYLDLCDPAWRLVKITAGGWEVCDQSPIAFRRSTGELSLPAPIRGGSVDQLREHVNVASDDDFKLVVTWLLTSLRATSPYPVLILHGEQGSAKTTASRVLRLLLDPNKTPLRSEPRSQHDLMIAAGASWLNAFDNLSGFKPWLSDALCRLSTGSGFTTRALYTDDEEIHFNAARPILLNGIDDVADRPDLLSRAIQLRLPMIPEDKRQEESKFWSSFTAGYGQILGALLDAYAGALKVLPDVHLQDLPRMADFARFGEAVGRFLGWGDGAFLKAFTSNIERVTVSADEASPVATAIHKFMAVRDDWSGTTAELLAELRSVVSEQEARAKSWPSDPRKLSSELTRVTPVLRRLGIDVKRPDTRTNKGRLILITKRPGPSVSETQSQPSLHSTSLENMRFGDDGTTDGLRDSPATVIGQSPTVTGSPPNGHNRNSFSHRELHGQSDGCDDYDDFPFPSEEDDEIPEEEDDGIPEEMD